MDLKLSDKLKRDSVTKSIKIDYKDIAIKAKDSISIYEGNNTSILFNKILLLPIFFFILLITIFIISIVNLQIVKGDEYRIISERNILEIENIQPYRGAITDINGIVLAKNIPAYDLVISLKEYRIGLRLNEEDLLDNVDYLNEIISPFYINSKEKIDVNEKMKEILGSMTEFEKIYNKEIIVIPNIDEKLAIEIKSKSNNLKGIVVKEGFKRNYPLGNSFAHILGYTGIVFAEDLEKLDYIKITDQIGKLGVEKSYDKQLIGEYGEIVREVDRVGTSVNDNEYRRKEAKSGDTLVLSIDSKAQEKMYNILANAVKKYGATGGAGILQDVNTGEIIVLASYPSYNNNLFIGGISSNDFNKLLNDKRGPLNNKAIGAQVPPGSTFKTIVAASALDAKVINTSTTFLSSSNYKFSNGVKFQEYRDNSYGVLNVNDAISVSSNIFFCETIRRWDMNKLVPYLKSFGIGEYSGIDIPGEGMGMLPSPENKIALAKSTSPWLDPIWYPEGDSCNSVIGQGITTVTPLQMSNWVATIANGGVRYKPHVAKYLIDSQTEEKKEIKPEVIEKEFISKSALDTVKLGMWSAVNGPRRTIGILSNLKVSVGAKTGTAEFGRVNSKGQYEHTHAWVTGFFPYEKPQYSFVVFLEDGGESYNSATTAKEFIDWYVRKN